MLSGQLLQYSGRTSPNTNYHFAGIEVYRDNLIFSLWNGTGLTSNSSSDNVTDDNWHQVVMTYDGAYKRGYLDGSLVSSAQAVTWDSPMDDSEPGLYFYFGAKSNTSAQETNYFSGSIRIMRIYNKTLTSNEIAQNYAFNQNTF